MEEVESPPFFDSENASAKKRHVNGTDGSKPAFQPFSSRSLSHPLFPFATRRKASFNSFPVSSIKHFLYLPAFLSDLFQGHRKKKKKKNVYRTLVS